MPKLRWYQIFISHAWNYDENHRIKAFLINYPYLKVRDLSVPYDNSLNVRSQSELKDRLKQLIRCSHIVIVPAGMEVSRSYWVQFEINYATDVEKPIVGIIPWGRERIPKLVDEFADEIVGWNSNSIVRAVRQFSL